MAGVSVDTGKGGKKSLDVSIPLVPFIDLLCSLIAFLLMTAVWTQIARLELKQGNAAPQETPPNATPTPPTTVDLRVEVHEKGFTIVENNKDEQPVACKSDQCLKAQTALDKDGKPLLDKDGKTSIELVSYYDYDTLTTKLKAERDKYPDQHQVVVILADKVPYNEMIRTMDVCLLVGLDQPSVSGTPL